MNNRPLVSLENWMRCQEFRDWLALEFDLHTAPKELQYSLLTLLPASIAEERLTGAIKQKVLQAAIDQWNTKPQDHYFVPLENGQFRYLGIRRPDVIHISIFVIFGRLKRSLTHGALCRSPLEEVERVYDPRERTDGA